MHISVEAWSPDYGGGVDLDEPEARSVETVKVDCETTQWSPIAARDGARPDGPIAFVDGTRRIDARLFLSDNGEAPKPGVAGSVGAGAVVCSGPNGARARPPAAITELRITRHLAVGGGRATDLPAGPGLEYRGLPVPEESMDRLVDAVHNEMRSVEASLAIELAEAGHFVFADGPLAVANPGKQKIIGFIKSHNRHYLPEAQEAVLGELDCGQRTPVFSFGEIRSRYSWYVRLCALDRDQHAWHGLARCEVPAALSVDDAVALADASTAVLPEYASAPHWDPRAPQNLVPIAGLERRLRHLLGDRELVYRMIRSAARRKSDEGGPRG